MAHLAGFEPTAFRLGVQRAVFSIVCCDVLQCLKIHVLLGKLANGVLRDTTA